MEDHGKPCRPRCIILGGGGHARVLVDCLLDCDAAEIVAVLDADPSLCGESLLGVPIVGSDEHLTRLAAQGATHFVVGLGGAGNNRPRRRLFELGCAAGLLPLAVRHPSAVVSHRAEIGVGSQILPLSVVNAGATLGRNVIVNTGAIIEHDCVVADHVHVASGACLASTVRVGEGAHVGAGATVRQRIVIEAEAVVGAGAVVVRDVAAGTVVAGVPAREIGSKD